MYVKYQVLSEKFDSPYSYLWHSLLKDQKESRIQIKNSKKNDFQVNFTPYIKCVRLMQKNLDHPMSQYLEISSIFRFIPCNSVLFRIILYYSVLFCIILYYSILFCIILYYSALFCIIPYYSLLVRFIPYYLLFCIIL